ncbi:hypothetical protein LXA43DRAFT_266271 [Ganoderma leucocontextum]|nr:hypothetical protein LXA43DRAFT_266271 [Ganoderma leucocontextum]
MEPGQSTKGDAALVVEMIKLLSDELQRVQTEIEDLQNNRRLPTANAGRSSVANADKLYALQEENLRMRSQIEDVRARLDDLRGARRSPPVNAERRRLDERLSELSEEASKKDAEYKTREKLLAKIEAMREKYKEQKAIGSTLQESTSEVETQIASIEGARAEGLQRLESLTDELTRQKALFDSRAFLDEPRTGEEKIARSASFPASGTKLVLPEAVSKLCVPSGYMAKRSEEIAWSQHTPMTRCLVLGPTHRYNPKLRNSKGGWEAAENTSRGPEETELFYRESKTHWCYLGTFQYVGRDVRSVHDLGNVVVKGVSPLADEVYATVDMVTSLQGLELIRTNTVVFEDMVPQILIDLLKNMYDNGLLKVACVGWRRIGFNQALADALQAMSKLRLDQGPSTSTVIQVPKESSGTQKNPMKRDLEEEID